MSAEDLTQRVERLEAIEGVRGLLARYATTIDRLPPAGELGDLFCADAVLDNGTEYIGRPAIVEYYGTVLSTLRFARHHILNSAITVHGPGRAQHRGYFVALLGREAGPLLVFGDYDDTAQRDDDGVWRFHRKGNFGAGSVPLPDGTQLDLAALSNRKG